MTRPTDTQLGEAVFFWPSARLCLGPGTRYSVRRPVHARGRVGTGVHASDAFPPPGHMHPPLHSPPPPLHMHLDLHLPAPALLPIPRYRAKTAQVPLSTFFRPVCTSWRSSFPMDPIPCHPVFWSQSHFAFPLELERIVAVGAVSSTLLSKLPGLSLSLCAPPPLHTDLGLFPHPLPRKASREHCLVLAPHPPIVVPIPSATRYFAAPSRPPT